MYSPRDGKKIRKVFPQRAAAMSWRADAKRALDHGTLRAPGRETLRQAAEKWLEAAEVGTIKNRNGGPYKPATLRGYRQALEDHVLPELGGQRFAALTTHDIQVLIDQMEEGGDMSASSIRNAVKPLRAMYRRAKARGRVALNPTIGLEQPSPEAEEKVEIVAPEIAYRLIDTTPDQDRALWATAIYAGLRYGELRALRWSAVDLAAGRIHVRESWDPKEGPIAPKTKTSVRVIPISGTLRDHLLDHRLTEGEPDPAGLVFQNTTGEPFAANVIYRRADKAWRRAELEALADRDLEALAKKTGSSIPADPARDDLIRVALRHPDTRQPDQGLRLHQARHTCVSLWIAAGLDPKTLSAYAGHSSIKVTYDLYGHLIPGSMEDDRDRLDAYLERSNTAARIRAIDGSE